MPDLKSMRVNFLPGEIPRPRNPMPAPVLTALPINYLTAVDVDYSFKQHLNNLLVGIIYLFLCF